MPSYLSHIRYREELSTQISDILEFYFSCIERTLFKVVTTSEPSELGSGTTEYMTMLGFLQILYSSLGKKF